MTKFTKIYIGFIAITVISAVASHFINKHDSNDESNSAEQDEIANDTIQRSDSEDYDSLASADIVAAHFNYKNSKCPIDINMGGQQITGVEFDGSYIKYQIRVEDNVDSNSYMNKLKEAVKGEISYMYVIDDDEYAKILESCIRRNIELEFNVGFNGNNFYSFTITPNDIRLSREKAMQNSAMALQGYIQNIITFNNTSLPRISDGYELNSIVKSSDNFMFTVYANDDAFGYCQRNNDEMNVTFYYNMKVCSQQLLDVCNHTKMGIIFNIISQSSSKKIQFNYSYDILKGDPMITLIRTKDVSIL